MPSKIGIPQASGIETCTFFSKDNFSCQALYKMLFAGLCILLPYFSVIGQRYQDEQGDKKVTTELFDVDEDQLRSMLKNLTFDLSYLPQDELTRRHFLSSDIAEKYARSIYHGADAGADEKKLIAIGEFYTRVSSEAREYFESFRGMLEDIELYRITRRLGNSTLMQVVILHLNLHMQGGNKQSVKVNTIYTEDGYRILNLEN